MCNFFSLLSNGKGQIYYFDYKIRKQIISGKSKYNFTDSHTSIADYFKLNEDKMNKWEYNPLTQRLASDQLNTFKDDNLEVLRKCKQLDFKLIVPELIIKPIIHPFRDIQAGAVTEFDINLLKKWVAVRNTIRNTIENTMEITVWNTIWYTAWNTIESTVWNTIWDTVGSAVRNTVWDTIGNTADNTVGSAVRNTIRDTIGNTADNTVWDAVSAYTSSFLNLPKWKFINHELNKNPFQPGIDLWEKGLIPSFDGKKWRLHGVQGSILWEGEI